jgi:threonine/homoserine/homoserine lactone efflux protein
MPETLIPYILYCLAMSGTPGPNNIMVMASGANYGYRATLPHVMGVNVGFALMLVIMALGLASAFLAVPGLQTAMKVAGIAYVLWLAWKIATATGVGESKGDGEGGAKGEGRGKPSSRPLTFLEGAAFQWVNVKAWMMVMGAIAVYGPPGYGPVVTALYLGGVMFLAGTPPTDAWTLFGVGIRRFLDKPKALRAFNIAIALLLVLSLVPMVW